MNLSAAVARFELHLGLLQSITNLDRVATQEFLSSHGPFPRRLDRQQTQESLAGGNEQPIVHLANRARCHFSRRRIHKLYFMNDKPHGLTFGTLPLGVSAWPGLQSTHLILDGLRRTRPIDLSHFFGQSWRLGRLTLFLRDRAGRSVC